MTQSAIIVVVLALAIPLFSAPIIGASTDSVESWAIINQVVNNHYSDKVIVDFVAAHPTTAIVQQLAGYDVSDSRWGKTRAKFASIRAEAARRKPPVTVLLCTDSRPDVYRRSTAVPENFGGLTWSDDWLLRVESSTHRADLAAWTGGRSCGSSPRPWNVDWFNSALGGSEDWCNDRGTPGAGTVPIVYGDGEDGCSNAEKTDLGCANRFSSSGFLAVDLRRPEWRAFSVRRTIAQLTALSNEPGGNPSWVPECIFVGYKPGWWMRYDAKGGSPCWTPDGRSYSGYARPRFVAGHSCRQGPLDPTPYGEGEFEAALNAWAHELDAALTAKGEPYASVKIITQEAPRGSGTVWSWMDSKTHASRRFLAEISGVVTP